MAFPPGLVGRLASHILDISPRPVPEIALATAIGLMSGVCQRSYNVSRTGLNQYILVTAPTGVGKDIISSAIDRIVAKVSESVPAAREFLGPREIASPQGLTKWLTTKPSPLMVFGEFAIKLKEMAKPNAPAHIAGQEAALLSLYTKSGMGEVWAPTAYSDQEKNTAFIHSPAVTLLCETVPHRLYETLNETTVSSGLLPRFLTFEVTDKRSYLNTHAADRDIPEELLRDIASLFALSLTRNSQNQAYNVPLTDEANLSSEILDIQTTDAINASQSDSECQLYNRVHIKTLKLAAVVAVGINWFAPVIDDNCFQWAADIVMRQTESLIAKFKNGEVGDMAGNQIAQQRALIKVIREYCTEPYLPKYLKYDGTEKMHQYKTFTKSFLMQKLRPLAPFKNDRQGPKVAVERSISNLLEGDKIREYPKHQMLEAFASQAKAYIATDPETFLEQDRPV